MIRGHFELEYVHVSAPIMARLCFCFRHCGESYLPNWEGTGRILSVRRGETYLPHAANLIYNPQLQHNRHHDRG